MTVLKVVTDQDVDGVTIVINPQTNKLEANIPPATANAVEIEEVTGITNYNDAFGNRTDKPFGITKAGTMYPITKVGRIKGTNWLVLQADGLLETDPNPTPTKETIRIPTSVLVKDMSDPNSFESWNIIHRVSYTLTPENNAAFKTGKVSSNATLEFKTTSPDYSRGATSYINLPADIEGKGEIEVNTIYGNGTTDSEIESATASGAITVETEDKIYMYELVSPVTVVKRGEVDPSRSFTAEVNCGEYTWEEQPDYRYGTAIQPATVTLSSNDFTADDIQKVTLYTKRLDSEDELWIYETEEINSMVISIPEWTDEVHNPDYVTVTTVEVLLKDGLYVRANVRAECPITK